MIEFKNVTKIYPNNTLALEDVSFEVGEGEFVLIAGRSGAGKTTLLRLILAEEEPTSGRILFQGADIHEMKKNQLPFFRRQIGSVFQDYKLLSTKTIFENVAFALEVVGAEDKEICSTVPKVLDIVGLGEKTKSFPQELSAGERQRAAIARALIHRPKVILADEPTGNLDPYNTSEIIELFQKINESGTTVFLATHNKSLINKFKKRVLMFKGGRLANDDDKKRFIM